MNIGALAGGIAGGFLAGEQVKQRRADQAYKKSRDEREAAEYEWKKEDRENMQSFWKRVGSEVLSPGEGSMREPGYIQMPSSPTDLYPVQMPGGPQSVAMLPPQERPDFGLRRGFASGGLVTLERGKRGFAAGGMLTLPDEQLARQNAPAVYQGQAGGLAAVPGAQQAPQPAPPAQQPMDPKMEMQRRMLDGNLLDDPDSLTQIARIAVEEGLGAGMIPWLEQARTAKQKGMMTGAIKLMQGNVDEAIDDLKRGGMKLGDRPTKVVPDDPDDHRWKINIEGQGERVMDVSHLLATTMDPEKYFDVHFKRGDARRKEAEERRKDANEARLDRELGFKEREASAGIGLKQAQADYYRGAKSEAERARAERYERQGEGGSGGSADRPEKIDSALKRRDEAIEKISADNLGEANPDVRRTLYTVADYYQHKLEKARNREMNSREINILTDHLHSFPLDDPSKQKAWSRRLMQRFGGDVPEETRRRPVDEAQTPQQTPSPTAARAPSRERGSPGGLADTASAERLALPYKNSKYYEPMLNIQRALRDPGLSVEQRRTLALQAQHIAKAYAQEYGARR